MSAPPERRSREWSTCVACRNLNRIKNFGANNNVARVQNSVKGYVVFSTNEFVIISNRDQETQTKPETSEEILESSDVSLVTVLKFNYFYTLYRLHSM